ncbi:MAG: diguanylate cyclase [Rhodocyclaceae bacterium]|nr:diguanylate cyclase [Rhodocyclaceae bacterium]
MSLNKKTLAFFAVLMGGLIFVLTALTAFGFRRFSLYTAERHARSVAEAVKVGLTESMINGTIDKRLQFLSRLAAMPGVEGVRVARGQEVVKQYGPGFVEEAPKGHAVESVLANGKERFEVIEAERGLLFVATIPYIATDHGTPNCLQCHQVKNGAVLGAINIEISLSEVRREAGLTVLAIAFLISLASVAAYWMLRRLLRPLTATAAEVRAVTTLAINGDFSKRVQQDSSDEIGDIAHNVNHLMDFLEREIGNIRLRVGQLMGQTCPTGGNQLVHAVEMVESLVEAARFKQAIEEDQSKEDIYRRLARVIEEKLDVGRYSIYEVAASKNRMTPVLIDGKEASAVSYCDPQILIDSSSCRARRTGHLVDGAAMPTICTMFRPGLEPLRHICLPINQSGEPIVVIQLVAPEDAIALVQVLVPYFEIYLREAGPVLEAKRLMEHLRENALRDGMTGLYNRRFLEEYASQLIALAQRRQSRFSILMLDMDYFKQVNDRYGHEAGDKVLKTLAEILSRSVRGSDVVVRYGGEEFLIVLVDTPASGALKVAEKIRAEVEQTKMLLPSGVTLQKTISIGVAEYPEDADSFWQVVKYADVALYRAKEQGRNRVLRFTPEMWDVNAY